MSLITQGPEGEQAPYGVNKTNIKYILIVVILAAIVGGGVLIYESRWIIGEILPQIFPRLSTIVDPADQKCENDEECAWAVTKCPSCECGTPINKQYQEKYDKLWHDKCKDYNGPVCDVYCTKIKLECINKLCVAVEATQEDEIVGGETYQSQVGNFSVKYPKGWFVRSDYYSTRTKPILGEQTAGAISSDKDFLLTKDSAFDAFLIVFNIYEKVDYITLDDFILTYKTVDSGEFFYPDIVKEGRKTLKVGGKDAIWLQGNLGPAVEHIEVYIPKDETHVIVVDGWDWSSKPIQDKYINLLNQILSTFKFIE